MKLWWNLTQNHPRTALLSELHPCKAAAQHSTGCSGMRRNRTGTLFGRNRFGTSRFRRAGNTLIPVLPASNKNIATDSVTAHAEIAPGMILPFGQYQSESPGTVQFKPMVGRSMGMAMYQQPGPGIA